MKTCVAILCLALVGGAGAASWGWMQWSDDGDDVALTPQTPITERCLQLAAWGRCEFYDCLEERFPCGAEGYLMRVSKHFCGLIDARIGEFDAFGRRWLNMTSVCLVGDMKTIYEQDTTTCSDIQDAGIESIIQCNDAVVDGKDFCHFTNTNSDVYNSLMGSDELRLLLSLREPRVVTSMLTQAVSCGVDSLSNTWNDMMSSVSEGFQNLYRWFQGSTAQEEEN